MAIVLNVAALKSADVLAVPTGHGGLQQLITPWLAGPLEASGMTILWQRAGLPLPGSSTFQTAFHVAVGLAMAVVYAFAVEPVLPGRAIVKGIVTAAVVWLLNAAVVLPLIGEGFAGSRDLSPAGLIWFAAAHTLFFAALSLVYEKLRVPS